MDKLNSILVVVDDVHGGLAVLDKAVRIARCFQARIELMLGDSTQACTFANHCTRQGYEEVLLYSFHRGEEPVHDVIVRRVLQQRPDLIVKQSSGPHPLRRWTLRDNDWRLVQESPAPIMLAGARPWTTPLRMAAAVDVSDRDAEAVTRGILQSAGFLALGSHAELDILYSERERRDETLRMQRAVKLAQLVREFHVGSEHIQILNGLPEQTLPDIIKTRRYDLLVLGAVTHRSGLGAALTNLTGNLVDAAEGDVVLVKAAELGARRAVERPDSTRQQIPHQREQLV